MNTIKVADEVWIATALLHRENPKREDFNVAEIIERARRENISGGLRAGVQVHAYLHCVANRPPNPGSHRMLYATGKSTRRLFRETDDFDPKRRRGKVTPDKEDIPASINHCSIGTAKNSPAKERVPWRPTQSLDCADWEKKFGSAKSLMTTSAAFVEAGSEPNFLGHEPVYLFD